MEMAEQGRADLDLNAVLLTCLAERGIAANMVQDHPVLCGLLQPNRRGYRESEWLGQLAAAIQLSGDPALMLRLGQHIHLADIGVLGFALMSCDDLREVIKIMLRYHPIANNLVEWRFLKRQGGSWLRAVLPGGTSMQRRMIMETVFSTVYSIGQNLIQGDVDEGELHLDYPPPDHTSAYDDVFAVPVRFAQDHCQLFIPDSLLARKVRTANPSGRIVFIQQCERLMQDMNRADDVAVAVRRQLIRASGAFPEIADVATELHMSERSLRRRLSEEKTSFRAIRDEVRNVLARQYLAETGITVSEIALLLDYTEPSSFRRAFIRWNGVTPDGFRLQSRQGETS